MQTEMTAYEQRKAQDAAQALVRHQHALAVADALAAFLTHGGSTDWTVKTFKQEYGHDTIEVTNGHGIIRVHAGGFRQHGRVVAFVPTTRYVQFGPDDYDTVQVTVTPPIEATVADTKSVGLAAKEFGRRLGSTALNVADALDAEQARMSALRDKGQAVLAEFRAAGWSVSHRPSVDTAYVYVPVDHALYRLGITALKVDPDTGGIEYQSRPYAAHDITVAELVGVKF